MVEVADAHGPEFESLVDFGVLVRAAVPQTDPPTLLHSPMVAERSILLLAGVDDFLGCVGRVEGGGYLSGYLG
jgi:hypothetical protein